VQDGSFLYYIGMLLIFVVILAMAWLTTRLLGKKVGGNQSKSMKVVERLSLGVDRSLLIVQVGTKHYLFVSTRSHLEFAAEVEPSEIPQEAESGKTFDFKAIFDRYSGLSSRTEPDQLKNRKPDTTPESDETEEEPKTDLSAKRVVRNINRMKNLTRD
jgi:flagellar protein FliO/FliZ